MNRFSVDTTDNAPVPRSRFSLNILRRLASSASSSPSVDDATMRTTDDSSQTSDSNHHGHRTTDSDPPKMTHGQARMRSAVNAILNERALEEHPDYSSHPKWHQSQPSYLRPLLRLRPFWDMFIFVLLLYVSIFSVFVYSFYGVIGVSSAWFWVERFLDVAFALDIILSFFLPPYNRNGQLVHTTAADIRTRYLRTWFLPDVLATFPWDALVLAIIGEQTSSHLLQLPRFLRLLKLLKLTRLLRFFRLKTSFISLEVKLRLKYAHVRLFALFTTVIFIAHWFACAFFYFGSLGLNTPWTAEDYVPSDLFGKYITALYFSVYTITTIGYGDVTPENTVERTYTTVIMFLGAACFAYVISQIRMYFHRANRSLELQSELELLSSMTTEHRIQVLKHIYRAHLTTSRLFAHIPPRALDNVYEKVREKAFMSGQKLYKRGEITKSFFILMNGSVVLREQGEQPVTLDKQGELFGDNDILFNQRRKGDATCTDFTTVICVPREAVMEVLREHPAELKKLRDAEALKLWKRAITNVEQQIRFVRFARMMRHKAEEHMRMKGEAVQVVSSDTSTEAILKEIRCESVAAHPIAGESSLHGSARTGSVEELKAELERKRKHIKQLERQLRLVQSHFSEVMKVLRVES
ncbi:Potassium channel AKT2/3 [Gracilariopsis chorda]|uniref:Potassium channel AKT2/3 n=1 Tax=Gracilariopsis chorda TaxID=448386 RepID=A0A2V3J6M1_9FLOR|nr:Potassium channel AKT2/3 [Gracilariopsis chorda]|eukprot:PXF49953.1 Potassium channel AKT2/3 [Gracilariopsis chorda]